MLLSYYNNIFLKVEGSKTSGTGATETSADTDRGEVMTPTHRFLEQ